MIRTLARTRWHSGPRRSSCFLGQIDPRADEETGRGMRVACETGERV